MKEKTVNDYRERLNRLVFVGETLHDDVRRLHLERAAQRLVYTDESVTNSMAPEVPRGDRVLADKTAYRRTSPQIGDIAFFDYPDDRSKVFIRQIAGLPGEKVKLSDGREEIVPHGLPASWQPEVRQVSTAESSVSCRCGIWTARPDKSTCRPVRTGGVGKGSV